jgi:hypothetical protein
MATNPSGSVPGGFNPGWYPTGAVAAPSSLGGHGYGTRGASPPGGYAAMASGKRKNRRASRRASRRSTRRMNTRRANRKNRRTHRR